MVNAGDVTIPENPGWSRDPFPEVRAALNAQFPMRPLLLGAPPRAALPDAVRWPFPYSKLNQGNTGTCTEHGILQHMMCDPMPTPRDLLPPQFSLYDKACTLDAFPQNDRANDPARTFGTTSDAIARAAREAGLIDGWVWAQSMDEILQWYATKGPMCFGLDWSGSFNRVDDEGFIVTDGRYTAGHFFASNGYDVSGKTHARKYANCLQSWGDGWGINGEFKIELDLLEDLVFTRRGDALAAVQVGPVPPPAPPVPPEPATPVPTPDFPEMSFVRRFDRERWAYVIEVHLRPGTGGWTGPNWTPPRDGVPQGPWQQTYPPRWEAGELVYDFVVQPETGGWPV